MTREDVIPVVRDPGGRSPVAEPCSLPPPTTAADISCVLRPQLHPARISP